MRRAVLFFSAFLAVGCPAPIGPNPDTPPSPNPNSDEIEAMCSHLRDLGCEEGQAVYNDDLPGPVDVPNQSCEDFHKALQNDGVPVNAKCVVRTPDCRSIETYRVKNPEGC